MVEMVNTKSERYFVQPLLAAAWLPDKYSAGAAPLTPPVEADNKMKSLSNKGQGKPPCISRQSIRSAEANAVQTSEGSFCDKEKRISNRAQTSSQSPDSNTIVISNPIFL